MKQGTDDTHKTNVLSLSYERDIAHLSLEEKCRIAGQIIAEICQAYPQDCEANLTEDYKLPEVSLLGKITAHLKPSDAFEQWQNKKRSEYFKTLREGFSLKSVFIQRAYKDWNKCALLRAPLRFKKYALKKAFELHMQTYLDDIPEFTQNLRCRFNKIANSPGFVTYGQMSYRTHTAEWTGTVEQDPDEQKSFSSAEKAFETMHHECTHAVHFLLGLAHHCDAIPENHPLADDAKLFYLLYANAIIIPGRFHTAYRHQPHEENAYREGELFKQNYQFLMAKPPRS